MVQLKTQDYNVYIFTQGWGWELVWVRHIVVKTTSYRQGRCPKVLTKEVSLPEVYL